MIGKIAETSHSRVWEAAAPGGERVAVKELKTRRIDSEPYVRFRDEVAFHASNRDPGVLPILEACVPATPSLADPVWLAMPIARTVRAALGDAPSLDHIVGAVRCFAGTLDRLAGVGVHHRDLKPDNLFRIGERWLVGDFGLVTWPGKAALTEPGQKLGPAHFVAPEMVDDAAGADPGPADVWSLAKVLWVLATGQSYPPPGQLRVDEPATVLRYYNAHPRAAALEGILEQATRLSASERPTMRALAEELQAWSPPPAPPPVLPDMDELIQRIQAISAPAQAADRRQLDLRQQAAAISDRLRVAHKTISPLAQRLGRTMIRDDEALSLHALGGKTGRRDVMLIWTESLTLAPHSQHQVSLSLDLAWELFESWDMRLVVGVYFQRSDQQLPEVDLLETRDVRAGTEHGRRAADDLARLAIARFPAAARRYADLLEEAEARAQQSRQPRIESIGTNYVFRTAPQAGVIEIRRRSDGSVDGHAVAWLDAAIVAIRAEGDRLQVRSAAHHGWIERNSREQWVLATSEPNTT